MNNHVHWIITVFKTEAGLSMPGTWESDFPKSNKSESVFETSDKSATWESCNPKQQVGNPQSPEKPIYLQNILHSVKQFTARRINKIEHRSGQLWEYESFDTTIRNDRHFVSVFNYVIQNPVSAGLVHSWDNWSGTRTFPSP